MSTSTPITVGELVGTDFLNSLALAFWRDTTLVDVVSSTTETDLIGVGGTGISIPANTLGTQRMLRVTLFGDSLNNSGSNNLGPAFALYYGGTSTSQGAIATIGTASSANRLLICGVFYVVACGATNAQALGGYAAAAANNGNTGITPAAGSTQGWTPATIDSTVAQNLRLTVKNTSGLSTVEFRKKAVIVEVV